MTTFLTYTLLGLVLGAVYFIAASGLVLTYNTSGIFNFAHGAQAMLGTFLFWQLKYDWGWPTLAALLVVIGLVGPLLGAALHALIMRGLRDTADVTKIIVTVAVLLGMVYLSQWIWNPDEARTVEMFFGADAKVTVLGVVVRYHEIVCLVAAAAIAIGLRVLFTRSRIGVVMRGSVDDPDLLRLNGHDPERAAMLSWALGSTLAVTAGVLIVPVGGGALEANMLTLLVIDAFAAAMFGRLRSIPRTFAGAMVLGLAATYVMGYLPASGPVTGNLRVSLPMIVLFVVLVVLPQDRLRGAAIRTRERYRVPTVRSAAVWGLVLVAVVYLYSLLLEDSGITTLTLGMTFAIIALSLTVLTGYAGELNLAPLSFGAVATIVAFHFGVSGSGLSAYLTPQGVLAGVAAAALVGGLIALPALRLRGLYLALATMAFGVFLSNMVLRDTTEHELFGVKFTLFPNGTLAVPPPKLGPLDLRDGQTFLMTATVLFALLGVALAALRNSGYGRRLAAMKDSPAATAMLGQDLVRLKLSVFMISAGIAGLGGVLMSAAAGSVSGENFTIMGSLALLMLVVVAGIGYISGALLGGLMSGVGATVLVGTFNDLALEHEAMSSIYSALAHLVMVGTALVGMGVGRNPSGFVHDIVESYRHTTKPVRYGGAAVGAVLYVLALTDVIGVWTFAIAVLCGVMLLPVIGRMLQEEGRRRTTPLELIGVDEPYTDQLRARLDRELGLPALPVTAEKGGARATA
ncbi:ABC transporter permease [Thermomonospora curvata]|uniref:Inner-membrane translocator n=1 Tax=Thermomonospora curvata (strain ATCC 19995 / DSM 43183 / JCM 3096 / KCTC 9072 / NBRC 15933 / NCIMB 10081 / Henssen B9) TaxID=471852 RepID=D1AB84_THECD|nr:ABC transporter permease [Thermomonospora curvata]ACY99027.1 inner-membrane translocator [Thermomonospora curvata DSM 43183]